MRDHSWLSISLILLLAASGVVVLRQVVAEDLRIVHQWDFTRLDAEQWQWDFPAEGLTAGRHGVEYETQTTGPGPRVRGVAIPAASVDKVRVVMDLLDPAHAGPVPTVFEFYWARTEDIARAEGAWPFSVERGMQLVAFDRHRDGHYEARVGRHPEWNGTIEAMFIGVRVPDDATGPVRVRTASIVLAE